MCRWWTLKQREWWLQMCDSGVGQLWAADAGWRCHFHPTCSFCNHRLTPRPFAFCRPRRTSQVTWTWAACRRPQSTLRRTTTRRTSSERRTPSWAGTLCETVWRRTPWTGPTMTSVSPRVRGYTLLLTLWCKKLVELTVWNLETHK